MSEKNQTVKSEKAKPEKKEGSFFKRHKAVTVLLAILLVILVVLGGVYAFFHGKLGLMQRDDGVHDGAAIDENDPNVISDNDEMKIALEGLPAMSVVEAKGEIFKDDDVFNVLLIGTDERTPQFNTNARGDTCMLLSINKKDYSVKLVSFERGMGVPILDGQYKGQYDWLTHTFRYGGADLMMREIRECFKIDVTHYIRVNLRTFEDGIDAIGGVDINLSQVEADYINARVETTVSAGPNHLNGREAITYARCRKVDSDWGRIQRQRLVVQSAMNGFKGASLSELNTTMNTVLPLVQTNLTEREIASLLVLSKNILGGEISQTTIPQKGTYGGMTGMGGRSMFATDFQKNSDYLQELLYGEK